MNSIYLIIIFYTLISLLIWSYLKPWIEFRKIGVSLTFKELMNPIIKKDIRLHKDTKRLLKTMSIAYDNELNIKLQDLIDIDLAGGDFELLVNAKLLIANHGLLIDKHDLKTLVLANIDFSRIVQDKEAGQKITAIDELKRE